MKISLDTNVWIFGLMGNDELCRRILRHISQFEVVVPDQVRRELNRNLSEQMMKRFYQFAQQPNVTLSLDDVPEIYITMFEGKGLKRAMQLLVALRNGKKWTKSYRTIEIFCEDCHQGTTLM